MSLLNSKIADYGDSVTLEDIGYPSSMLYDNSIVSTCESTPHTPFCEGFNKQRREDMSEKIQVVFFILGVVILIILIYKLLATNPVRIFFRRVLTVLKITTRRIKAKVKSVNNRLDEIARIEDEKTNK